MDSTVPVEVKKSALWGLVRLMRPRQWIKNAFVLAPLVFASEFTDSGALASALMAMVLFCAASSATYIVNDWHDLDYDRQHPVKQRTRPLASGQISKGQALTLLLVLLGSLATSAVFFPTVMAVIAVYLALNMAYTFVLKHQPVIDIFTIAAGFVLRVYAGAMALAVPVSSWMFVTTLCLALYLAAVKRRQELALSGRSGRRVLEQYTVQLVDRYAEMSATGALLFYSLFVMTARPEMVITIPLVLYGLFRYWFVVETKDAGESPTDALLSDWQLMATIIVWIGLCTWLLWSGSA